MVSCGGKICLLVIFVVVLVAKASGDATRDRILQNLRNNIITIKNKLQELKKTGALSFRCKGAECEICFKNQEHVVCNKIAYTLNADKKGSFTFQLSVDGADVPLPVVKGGNKGSLVCPKEKGLSDFCAKLNEVRTGLINDSGTAKVCYDIQLAGNKIFHACVEGVKGRISVSV